MIQQSQDNPGGAVAQRPKSAVWRKEPTAARPPEHEWQTAGRHGAGLVSVASRRKVVISGLLAAFVGLTALLVYELLLLPAKTTVIAAVADDYRWPLPPSAFSREDIDHLKSSLGGQTLTVRDLPLAGLSSGEALAAFSTQFDRAARQTRRGGTVIVYVSAHGAVNGEGKPCLLLPTADPLDSGTWLPLSDLLARIKSVKRHAAVHWLLVLDANRQDENWNIGLLQNSFADGLAQTVMDAGLPTLAVLNSTSPGQIACSSLHFRGSVFGHFFALGLAGAADENGDGQVSLQELNRYLKKSVDGWTCRHRAAHQMPLLCPADAADSEVAWSLNARDLARLAAPTARHEVAEESSAGTKLAPLWLAHQRLVAYHPEHYAPGAWQALQHGLLWLQEAATAGTAYREALEGALPTLQNRFAAATQWLQGAGRSGPASIAPIGFAAALAGDKTLPLEEINVYSQPLADYLGSIHARKSAERFADAELARLFERYHVDQLWPSPDVSRRAMDLDRLGERLAVPKGDNRLAADERAHTVIRPLLENADQRRRLAEDSVFVGPREAADIGARCDKARQKYNDFAALETTLAQDYQLRDRAWEELPYLAEWAAATDEPAVAESNSPKGNSPAETPRLKAKVLALVDGVRALDDSLRHVEQTAAAGEEKSDVLTAQASAAGASARQVAEILDQFHAQLHDAARRLPLAQATPETLREIAALLAVPMVTGPQRADLYSHYVEAAEEVDSDTPEGPAANREPNAAHPEPAAVATMEITTEIASEPRWKLHPAAALLAAQDAEKNRGVSLAALGEHIRSALRALAAGEQTVGVTGANASGVGLLDVERPLRRLVSLQSPAQAASYRGIERRYLQELLLWHARRALDDFWGTTEAGHPQYFAEVAEAYVADVRLLAHPEADLERRLQRLASDLHLRNEAALHGLTTTSTDLLLIDPSAAVTARIGVRETSAAAALPAGIAAVFLRDDDTPLAETVRRLDVGPIAAGETPAPLSGASDGQWSLNITLKARDLANRAAAMQAVALFRGHEFPAPLMRRTVGGPLVEVQRQSYGPSRITMRAAHLKKASIVFILDCSHSMADAVPVEEPSVSSAGAMMPKIRIAVDAMQSMMERLGDQGDVRVGVRFFGHRVGWRTDQNGAMARQGNYPGGVPATLRPYEDVELFLPLGRFDSVTAGIVNRRLKTLKPWGESPIFLSLMDALKDFAAEDAQAERRVVVVTDGMNYQFNPPPEMAPSLKDVEAAYANHGVAIDIVGFGIPEGERSTAVSDFTQLAQTTQGSFTLATNASALVHRLDQLVVKSQFRVLDDAGRILGETDLGGTVAVSPHGVLPQPCTIDVEQLRARTMLRGGEWLQLGVSRDGRKIVSLPYEEEGPIFAPLLAAESTSPSGYRVGLHRPSREGEGVVFPVSFQRDDMGIALPPAQVWIEITPLAQGRRMPGNCYVFYDATWEPDMPVPLMRCRCRDWPKGADQGEVRVWCGAEPVVPTEVVPLAKVVNQTPPAGEGFALASVPGVRYQVRAPDRAKAGERWQIRVVERLEAGVLANVVKVEMSGRPDHITHQFDWDRGIVLHSFDYDADTTQADPPSELRFLSRDKFTAAAWRMDQPVVLDIARHVEVVVPPRLLDSRAAPGGSARQ